MTREVTRITARLSVLEDNAACLSLGGKTIYISNDDKLLVSTVEGTRLYTDDPKDERYSESQQIYEVLATSIPAYITPIRYETYQRLPKKFPMVDADSDKRFISFVQKNTDCRVYLYHTEDGCHLFAVTRYSLISTKNDINDIINAINTYKQIGEFKSI